LSDDTATGNIENNDDLEAFEKDFFGTTSEDVEIETDEPELEEPDDDEPVADVEDEDEEEAEADPDPEEEEEEPEPKRNRKTAQERIKELTAKAREAERREVETLRRLRELEERSAPPKEEKQKSRLTARPTRMRPTKTVTTSIPLVSSILHTSAPSHVSLLIRKRKLPAR
jgi:outer membrane biosynthesis protein TonB